MLILLRLGGSGVNLIVSAGVESIMEAAGGQFDIVSKYKSPVPREPLTHISFIQAGTPEV